MSGIKVIVVVNQLVLFDVAYVCDDDGYNCRYMDICDDPLDLPSLEIDPLPSLPTLEIKPLPSLDLPPIGTSKCEYMMVNGQWQNVCR